MTALSNLAACAAADVHIAAAAAGAAAAVMPLVITAELHK
jgi:hypothetical protein